MLSLCYDGCVFTPVMNAESIFQSLPNINYCQIEIISCLQSVHIGKTIVLCAYQSSCLLPKSNY